MSKTNEDQGKKLRPKRQGKNGDELSVVDRHLAADEVWYTVNKIATYNYTVKYGTEISSATSHDHI